MILQPGKYKVVVAHTEERVTKTGRDMISAILVVISDEHVGDLGEVLYGFFVLHGPAEFVWRDAVEDPRDLSPGTKLWATVKVDQFRGEDRNHVSKIEPIEPPRTLRRYGSLYRFERRIPGETYGVGWPD